MGNTEHPHIGLKMKPTGLFRLNDRKIYYALLDNEHGGTLSRKTGDLVLEQQFISEAGAIKWLEVPHYNAQSDTYQPIES